jgi:hypothetical protein
MLDLLETECSQVVHDEVLGFCVIVVLYCIRCTNVFEYFFLMYWLSVRHLLLYFAMGWVELKHVKT